MKIYIPGSQAHRGRLERARRARNGKWCLWGFVLLLSAWAILGCGAAALKPTPTPPEEPGNGSVSLPDPARALEAALAYLRETYGELAPAPDLGWKEEHTTPQDLVGASTFQYTAGNWLITVRYPIVAPEATIYHVLVSNQTGIFWWEGRVDARGRVSEGPEAVPAARDAALHYVAQHHAAAAPRLDLSWTGRRTTPQGLLGAETFEYTAGDWAVAVSYPVVAPDQVVYRIEVTSAVTGFRWEGKVDAAGQVTEVSVSSGQ